MTATDPSRNESLLGQLAVARRLVTRAQVDECLRLQESAADKRLGQLLVERGYLQSEEVLEVLREQANRLRRKGPGVVEAPAPLRAGVPFGGYTVSRQVGRSAIGDLFELGESGEPAAVLRLLDARAPTALIGGFLSAARALRASDTPRSVVRVIEEGERGGRAYVVAEHFPGRSLKQVMAEAGGLSVERALVVIIALAEGLARVHELGVLHGDLRPSKVHFRADGSVAARAFGLGARHATPTLRSEPYYLAPELIAEPESLSQASEVYALGAVFYHMLAGRAPFSDQTSDAESAILTRRPTYIRDRRRKVPDELEAVCFQCLNKDPRARYPGAATFLEDCQRFLNGERVHAQPPSRSRHYMAWFKRWLGPKPLDRS